VAIYKTSTLQIVTVSAVKQSISYKNFAFLGLLSAKQRFVIKKTTFFESKNHLFLMKKGGFFIIETKSGRNQKPFGNFLIGNGLLHCVRNYRNGGFAMADTDSVNNKV